MTKKAGITINCNECHKDVFSSVHIQNLNRLTHNDYGLYSTEHENCVAIIIHEDIKNVHFHSGNLVCEECYIKLNEK